MSVTLTGFVFLTVKESDPVIPGMRVAVGFIEAVTFKGVTVAAIAFPVPEPVAAK